MAPRAKRPISKTPQKQKKSASRSLWRAFFYGSAVVGTVLVGLVVAVFAYFSRDLPDHAQLADYNPAVVTRLYAADGKLLEEYSRQNRIFVPITAMPTRLKQAFLAAEDSNFYTHPGVDFFSVMRAISQNISHYMAGRNTLIGASTITQQVAKNMLLTNERTLTRKVKEAILAFRMSAAFSKDRILELYLNEIYLGAGSYGVAAAALNYFNKSIDELTAEEAAMLAALPKAPSTYDPRRNYDRALARRDWVLERMYEENFLTEEEMYVAMDEPINLHSRDVTATANAGFFAEEVRRGLADRYGQDVLYEGGLTVLTTLDPELQHIAQNALRDGLVSYDRRHGFHGPITTVSTEGWEERLQQMPHPAGLGDWKLAVVLKIGDQAVTIGVEDGSTGFITFKALKWAQQDTSGTWRKPRYVLKKGDVIAVKRLEAKGNAFGVRQVPRVNGAIVAMDPHTGRVLAMVGGLTYKSSQFNRATQAKRQPGSAFKPFVYLAALENGFTPSSLINDEPIEFEMGEKRRKTTRPRMSEAERLLAELEEEMGLEERKIWAPQNYSGDFYGPTTLRTGLEKSRNVMTVHLGLALGIDKVMEVARRFAISENPQRNMATVLGAAEVTLLDVVAAYAALVNGGKKVEPAFIERTQDRNGKTIYRRDARECDNCIFFDEGAITTYNPPLLLDTREQLTDRRTAYQMVSMLEGVVQRGTGVRAHVIGKPLAGKTGTTNSSKDAWFIGFSPDLVVGVYVGFDHPRPLGEKETGASVALPVFVNFMEEALKDTPAIPFRIPPGIKLVRIDKKTGFLPSGETPRREVILEAFKSGTEPQISVARDDVPMYFTPTPASQQSEFLTTPRARDLPVTRGTGGIY